MQKLSTSDREVDDEDVMFKDVSFRNKAKRVTIALAVVISLLLVLCVVFIVLFALEKRKTQEQPAQGGHVPQKICDSRKCLFASVGKFSTNYFSIYIAFYPVSFFLSQLHFPLRVSMDMKGLYLK